LIWTLTKHIDPAVAELDRQGPRMRKRWRNGLLVASAGMLGLSCIPAPSVVVPAWSVQIVDKEAKPVQGISVREVWQDYSVETKSHEEMFVTPKDGRVFFPERRIWTPRIMRVLGPIRNVLSFGVHASFGRTAYLIIWGKGGLEGSTDYTPGKPLPDRVTVSYKPYVP
jgi:hypothetical protein